MRSRNCRPRLVYFLAIEITRRRLASTISRLAWRASRSPLCTLRPPRRTSGISRPAAKFGDHQAGVGGERMNVVAQALDQIALRGNELLPAVLGEPADAPRPVRIELLALTFAQAHVARDAIAIGKPHQLALERAQPLVDVVELLNQRLDAGLVER